MNEQHKETVLIVDDEAANLGVLFESLSAAGYRVLMAEDGGSALEVMGMATPDIALLDVNLPDMDGFELYERIKENWEVDVPVVFLTVETGIEEKTRAFVMEAVDYITKPFEAQEVTVRVERHLLLRSLQRQLLEQNAELEQTNRRLAHEIEERKQAQAEVRRYHQHLEELVVARTQRIRELGAHLTELAVVERRRLARELHDQVGQNLTAISINLTALQQQVPLNHSDPAGFGEQVQDRLADSLAMLKETTKQVRGVMDDLRPPALEDYGLIAALRWYGMQFAERTGIAVRVGGEEPQPRPQALVETTFFRIAQEALTNVARHAQAANVDIVVAQEGDKLRMTVADDGAGFAREAAEIVDERPRWGLLTMSERAETVHGRCWVESEPGRGTRVLVEVEMGVES